MICNVVGARPNFMKMGPVVLEIRRRGMPQILVHTGQHYDSHMSSIFFEELGMPEPDVHLGVGSGSHAEQTAKIMLSFEGVCIRSRPRLVVVGGDVNSTVACALVAAKMNIPVAHVEAGLRSFDRTMPEEVNRVVTDHLSDLLFTTEESGNENLRREGIAPERIHFVGNCMIDSLLRHKEKALRRRTWELFGLEPNRYGLATLHRPSNVDSEEVLRGILEALARISEWLPLIFPVHPRTRRRMEGFGLGSDRILLVEPLGYLDFLALMAEARVVLTDSGGIQEETTALGVPCVTVRENTERPVTLEKGTNRLAGKRPDDIIAAVEEALSGRTRPWGLPPLWDGKAAFRIVDVIETWNGKRGDAIPVSGKRAGKAAKGPRGRDGGRNRGHGS